MGQTFATWWTAQQQAAFFGASTLAIPVTYYTSSEDPATAVGTTINCSINDRGEQPLSGDYDRTVMRAMTASNRAEVASLTRGRWGHTLGGAPGSTPEPDAPTAHESRSTLEERVEALEREVAELKQTLASFRRQFE